MFPCISNFLKEISSLSHSIVFLYFFALITEEGFLFSLCYSLKLCIQMGTAFLFSFDFSFSIWGVIKDHSKPVQKPVGAPGASIVLTCLDAFTAPPPAACPQQGITPLSMAIIKGDLR